MKIRHMDKEYLEFLIRSKRDLVAFAKALGYTKKDCLAAYMMLKMVRIDPRPFVEGGWRGEDPGIQQMKRLLLHMKGLKYVPDDPDDMPEDDPKIPGDDIDSKLDL